MSSNLIDQIVTDMSPPQQPTNSRSMTSQELENASFVFQYRWWLTGIFTLILGSAILMQGFTPSTQFKTFSESSSELENHSKKGFIAQSNQGHTNNKGIVERPPSDNSITKGQPVLDVDPQIISTSFQKDIKSDKQTPSEIKTAETDNENETKNIGFDQTRVINHLAISEFSSQLEFIITFDKPILYQLARQTGGYKIQFNDVNFKSSQLMQSLKAHTNPWYSTQYHQGNLSLLVHPEFEFDEAVLNASSTSSYRFTFQHPQGKEEKARLQALSKKRLKLYEDKKKHQQQLAQRKKHLQKAKTAKTPQRPKTETQKDTTQSVQRSVASSRHQQRKSTTDLHGTPGPMSVSFKHVTQYEALLEHYDASSLSENEVTPLLQFLIERNSPQTVDEVIAYGSRHFGAKAIWHTLGARAALVMNDPQKALYWLNARPKGDHSIEYFALLALTQQKMGMYSAAIGNYQYLQKLQPNQPNWQIGLAQTYALSGDKISAKASYESLLETPLSSQTKQIVHNRIASLEL